MSSCQTPNKETHHALPGPTVLIFSPTTTNYQVVDKKGAFSHVMHESTHGC